MHLTRQIAKEGLTALVVLSLFFLSLAPHQVTAQPFDGSSYSVDNPVVIFCGGDPSGDNSAAHVPCHACRVTVAVLPAPPCVSEPATFGFALVSYPGSDEPVRSLLPVETYRSRAPPISV